MTRVFLGIGSNLGDRWKYLRDGVQQLPDVKAVSPVYETEPVGGPDDQGPYLNAVIELSTELSPRELLEVANKTEDLAARERLVVNGPRTLDIDVLWIEGVEVNEPDFQIPHPRMFERKFVLQPLSDLAPELVEDELLKKATGEVWLAGSL